MLSLAILSMQTESRTSLPFTEKEEQAFPTVYRAVYSFPMVTDQSAERPAKGGGRFFSAQSVWRVYRPA